MTSVATASPADTMWTEIFPPFKTGQRAKRQFFWFLAVSPFVVYWVGSFQREGGALLLGYLVLVPGFFGLGWFFLYAIWCGIGALRDEKRLLRAARAVFEERAAEHGLIQHLDMTLDGDVFSGLALAGMSLLVVQEGRIRKLRKAEIRGWRWEVQGAAQIVGNGDVVSKLELRAKDMRERERVNGFYLQTFEPARPEVHFRTSSEEVCKRWEVILENIESGRTTVD